MLVRLKQMRVHRPITLAHRSGTASMFKSDANTLLELDTDAGLVWFRLCVDGKWVDEVMGVNNMQIAVPEPFAGVVEKSGLADRDRGKVRS